MFAAVALLITAEASPGVNPGGRGSPSRVRVARAEMGEGVIVKEMSEGTILARLDADLRALEKARRG